MAERWQQWMPFHIDRFRGSPDVQAMHPAARMGYLYLLASAWQTDDCSITSDPLDLAALSGLGDDLWAVYGTRILRKFVANGDRLVNLVLKSEWEESHKVFEHNRTVRSEAGKRGNEKRWNRNSDNVPSQTPRISDENASQNIATGTGTGTGTGTKGKEQKQKPSSAKKRRKAQAKPPCKTDVALARHKEFKAAIGLYWKSKNREVDMPWGPPEGQALEIWLRESPNATIDNFRDILRNRFRSDVNHTERPSAWIRRLSSYAVEPLDRFGIPKSLGGITDGGTQQGATLGNRKADAANGALALVQAKFREVDGDGGWAGANGAGTRGSPGRGEVGGLLDGVV